MHLHVDVDVDVDVDVGLSLYACLISHFNIVNIVFLIKSEYVTTTSGSL